MDRIILLVGARNPVGEHQMIAPPKSVINSRRSALPTLASLSGALWRIRWVSFMLVSIRSLTTYATIT